MSDPAAKQTAKQAKQQLFYYNYKGGSLFNKILILLNLVLATLAELLH